MFDLNDIEYFVPTDHLLAKLLNFSSADAQVLCRRLIAQYGESFLQQAPGKITKSYPDFEMLQEVGIISADGVAQYRVHNIGTQVFITDGVWQRERWSLFPFTDESQQIVNYVNSGNLAKGVHTVIDPACGCGHTPLAIIQPTKRIGLDINQRAAFFTHLNAHLNGVSLQFIQNDILLGLPIDEVDNGVLFVTNMPFAITPYAGAISIAGDGGRTGTTYSVAFLKALTRYQHSGARLVMLTYSLGTSDQTQWEIEQQARALFPQEQISWQLVGEKVWRTGLTLTEPNPMPLVAGLPKKVEHLYEQNPQKYQQAYDGYRQLALELTQEGWGVLGGGILEVIL